MSSRRRARWPHRGAALIFGMLMLSLLGSKTAFGQDKADAQAIYKEGVELRAAGKHAQAVERFRRALAIEHQPSTYLALASSLYELDQSTETLAVLDTLFAEFGPTLNQTLRGRAEKALNIVETDLGVGRISIQTKEKGAVFVDKKAALVLPLDKPLRAKEGKHLLRITREGAAPLVYEVVVRKGEMVVVEVPPLPTPAGAEANPSSGGPKVEANPSSGGPKVEANPSSEGPKVEANPSSEGPKVEVNPSSEGPKVEANPSSEGPKVEANPSSEGPKVEANPSSGGPKVKLPPKGVSAPISSHSSRSRVFVAGHVAFLGGVGTTETLRLLPPTTCGVYCVPALSLLAGVHLGFPVGGAWVLDAGAEYLHAESTLNVAWDRSGVVFPGGTADATLDLGHTFRLDGAVLHAAFGANLPVSKRIRIEGRAGLGVFIGRSSESVLGQVTPSPASASSAMAPVSVSEVTERTESVVFPVVRSRLGVSYALGPIWLGIGVEGVVSVVKGPVMCVPEVTVNGAKLEASGRARIDETSCPDGVRDARPFGRLLLISPELSLGGSF